MQRAEGVDELRKLFLEKYQKELNNKTIAFHPLDLDRVKHDDAWLTRFLNHHEGDTNEALTMLWDTCEWRKTMRVNDISEQNVCLEYLKDGSLFPYGCDKDDKIMLVFRCKMHYKGQKNFDELKKCLIYWFERLERETNGDQITIFFDMMDTGLSNMDMEFTKYLISLNKQYYPSFLNYILIYEMPWVLNAAFKIIKSWLPARAVQKIKFLSKATIKEYVNPNKMLTSWGGDDEYVFNFTPEVRGELPIKSEEAKKKTVHFALSHSSPDYSPVSTSFRDMKSDDSSSPLLKVIHPNTVHFNWTTMEYVGCINVENVSQKTVLYKIKTTSPDRFRVRPNSGLLHQGVSAKITVVLQSDHHVHSVVKDKFLIMAMASDAENLTHDEIAELWKLPDSSLIEQHRLKCAVAEPLQAGQPTNGSISTSVLAEDLIGKIDQLKTIVYQMCECNRNLHKDLSYRQNVITILLTLLFILVLIILFFLFKFPSAVVSTPTHPSCSTSIINEEN